jgi:actin-like ATPase involved in cell morphogenesis
MKLGIDFGTNRTVVAAADRGNYPLASFEGPDDTTPEWIPSVIAIRGNKRLYGWDAWQSQNDPDWTIIRSVKRLLEQAGPRTLLEAGGQRVKVVDLLNGFARSVHEQLREHSNLNLRAGEPLEVVLGVPANANTNQRFLTVEAFSAAGFRVLGVLNEPSAASIEFGHRQGQTKASAQTILVYDLGGGTFDASLVTIDESVHHVMGSEGVATLGGDDFDQILADMALDAIDLLQETRDSLSAAAWFHLLEECRVKKEALNPNSRRIEIDFDQVNSKWGSVQIPVADFYELARPLMEETLNAAEELIDRHGKDQFEALYITGGGSELPLVSRVLRERFGRRVRRSTYARSATAIGLAIQADLPETYRLSEQLTRFFGVWREADAGNRIIFDPLLLKGKQLPPLGEPPLEIVRSYSPVHNIGHFRFLECSHCAPDGSPIGEVTLWDEIQFPFDPALKERTDLAFASVLFTPELAAQRIEERYRCDATGSIAVEISNRTAGYSHTYRLGNWNTDEKTLRLGTKRKRTRAASHHSR